MDTIDPFKEELPFLQKRTAELKQQIKLTDDLAIGAYKASLAMIGEPDSATINISRPPGAVGASTGARSSSKSSGGNAALEAARAQQEALERQQAAAEDFRVALESLRAEIGGPLAQVTLEYTRKEDDLAKMIEAGAINAEDAAEAYAILEQQRLKDIEAINAQKTPMKELLADLAFENSLLKMNNEERLFAIQTRGMDAQSVEKYGDSLRQLNADMEATNETIEAMDEARNSATGFFTDIMDGSKSATDSFKDFADSILEQLDRMVAEWLTAQLFGQ